MKISGLIFLTLLLSPNIWADVIAESQLKAKGRYKGFINKLKEDQASDQLDILSIDRLKTERAQRLELLEKARRDFISKRDLRRKQELTSEARDKMLDEELRKEKELIEARRNLFVRQREQINRALSSGKQVDAHDEFEVGKNYEDDSGEVEEDDAGDVGE